MKVNAEMGKFSDGLNLIAAPQAGSQSEKTPEEILNDSEVRTLIFECIKEWDRDKGKSFRDNFELCLIDWGCQNLVSCSNFLKLISHFSEKDMMRAVGKELRPWYQACFETISP